MKELAVATAVLAGVSVLMIAAMGESDVYIVENPVKPGGHSGWHTHTGPSLITIKSGTATCYDGDDPTCTPHVYPAGRESSTPATAMSLCCGTRATSIS